MTEQECLSRMVAPGQRRPGKYREGVIQVHVTRACDKSCFNCTQGSNLRGKVTFMSPDHFRQACRSLKGYYGVVGMFGGNPALHPQFDELCAVMREEVPADQRGIWSNNPMTVEKARTMALTFDPSISNLNVHLDREAYDKFKEGWPECRPVGLDRDSRHAPAGFVAMRDVLKKPCPTCSGGSDDYYNAPDNCRDTPCPECDGRGQVYDEARAWELISGCDINQHWSAMIGVFRGQLRAWFCEIAGAQAMLHQDEPDYPDTGLDPIQAYDSIGTPMGFDLEEAYGRSVPSLAWWQLGMDQFQERVRKHCQECGVPLRGHGELAMAEDGTEQVTKTHAGVFHPKRSGRRVEVVTELVQLGLRLGNVTRYLQNAKEA